MYTYTSSIVQYTVNKNKFHSRYKDIKLIDFGLVGKPEGGMSHTLETCCGSPAYAAPGIRKDLIYIIPLEVYWVKKMFSLFDSL